MADSWHKRRFEQRPSAIETSCTECGRSMWLPASKVSLYKRCSSMCKEAHFARQMQSLVRPCSTCGKMFRPRPSQVSRGRGLFCSQRCNIAAKRSLDEQRDAAHAKWSAMGKAGLIKRASGEDNPRWTGGRQAAVARRIVSGKTAEYTRLWRQRNPDKSRGYSKRRRLLIAGQLEPGTLERIGVMQRWRCAICRTSIRTGYHADHITPLARGGVHGARNIQLLCAPCNLRKNAKDPITYMREIGRLL